MNAIPSPALANAFTASGMIRAEHNDLERHRRELLIAPLEDQLLAAWSAEREGEGFRVYAREVDARISAIRKAAHEAAAERNREKRNERKRKVLALLAHGPMQRIEMEPSIGLSGGALKALLKDMVAEGMVLMHRAPGMGHQFVYEVAQ